MCVPKLTLRQAAAWRRSPRIPALQGNIQFEVGGVVYCRGVGDGVDPYQHRLFDLATSLLELALEVQADVE